MISVVTLTHNDENLIANFIANCQFADEIIVLDENSNDRTTQIAKSKNAIVYQDHFIDFNAVKLFAIMKASHPWVLFLKPNENASEALINEIKAIVSANSSGSYSIKSQLSFMGKVLKYSGSKTDLKDRLFNTSATSTVAIAKIKTLRHPLISNYIGFDRFNETLTNQAKEDAAILVKNNVRPHLYHFLLKPLLSLIKHYILKLGFLDGKEGFIYAYLMAFTVFKRYLYVWLNYRNLN